MTKQKDRHVKSPEKRYAVIPNVELFHSAILTSAHLINTDHSKIVLSNKDLSLQQVVVAVGPHANVKVGDWVRINEDTFPKEKVPTKHDQGQQFRIIPPLEKIGGTEYLFLGERNLKWIIQRSQEKNFKEVAAKPKSDLIVT